MKKDLPCPRALCLEAFQPGALMITVLRGQARAALRPAMRPNTAPDMSPVPNG
jgi:hypothetical protein